MAQVFLTTTRPSYTLRIGLCRYCELGYHYNWVQIVDGPEEVEVIGIGESDNWTRVRVI